MFWKITVVVVACVCNISSLLDSCHEVQSIFLFWEKRLQLCQRSFGKSLFQVALKSHKCQWSIGISLIVYVTSEFTYFSTKDPLSVLHCCWVKVHLLYVVAFEQWAHFPRIDSVSAHCITCLSSLGTNHRPRKRVYVCVSWLCMYSIFSCKLRYLTVCVDFCMLNMHSCVCLQMFCMFC